MPTPRTTTEKIKAIIFLVVLLGVVGGIFGYISLYNKRATEKLRAEIHAAKLAADLRLNFDKLQFNNRNMEKFSAKSILLFATSTNGQSKILFEKNKDETLPIASVTKLMTAVVVLENLDLKARAIATASYVGGDGTAKVLSIGREYDVNNLLQNMLISSDNDSARLLSSLLGDENFVTQMNQKARELGMTRTHYVNVTGLDPLDEKNKNLVNISTASDLLRLVVYINNKHKNLFEITRNPSLNFCSTNNECTVVLSTNQLLTDQDFKLPIVGGKTGQTLMADKNLALIVEPFHGILLVSIILGSKDNFLETKSLINHLNIK